VPSKKKNLKTTNMQPSIEQAVAAHRAGKLQEAEALYQMILQNQPKHSDANHNLGVLAVSVNKLAVALPLLKAALEANPSQGQYWISYIDALIKAQQLDAAYSVLEQGKKMGLSGEQVDALSQQLTPDRNPLHIDGIPKEEINTLLNFYQTGQHEVAEKLALEMTQKYPQYSFGWKVLGAIFNASGKLHDALKAKQKAVALEPNDTEAHFNLGNTLKELGRLVDAEASYRMAIALKPDYAEAHYNLGNTLKELARLADAEASYRMAITLKPDYAEVYSNLGNALNELGRLVDAEASYRMAIALKPDFAEAHYNLGNTLKDLGRLVDAEASYRQAITLKPDYAEAHYNLGNTLKELARLADAEASYRMAITLKPDYAEVYSNLGNALNELGRLVDAEASYRMAIALKPDYAEAHSNLGNTLKDLARLADAEESYRQAITLKPDLIEAHFNLGNTLKDLARLADAEVSYRQAITLKPDYAEAYSNLGNTLKELGRQVDAEASYRMAIALKPDYAEARYQLGILLYEGGDYISATKLFAGLSIQKSKSYLLRCLYLQNERSLFSEQLEHLINAGENNSIIGSLCLRSAVKYGTNIRNPYCGDPFNYVEEIDLTQRCNFKINFIEVIRSILSDKSYLSKNQGHLSNGYQTAGNLFSIQSDAINEIQRIIRYEIEEYRSHFEGSGEGLITQWPKSYELYGWLINMKSGGKLRPHIHENSWVSGSIYINVPPKIEVNSGNLVLCVDDQEFEEGGDKNPSKSIDVTTGRMVLFPASLMHFTIPFESEENRIVLAFDVTPS
jgi:tetratricopeptide (TPR) repeat protein